MKRVFLQSASIIIGLAAIVHLASCDDSFPPVVTPQASAYIYEFTVQSLDDAPDQSVMLRTEVQGPSQEGETHEVFYDERDTFFTTTPRSITTDFPTLGEITIVQSLRNELKRPKKSEYQVGLQYKLSIITLDSQGRRLGHCEKTYDKIFYLHDEDLKQLYPRTKIFKYIIYSNGAVDIK